MKFLEKINITFEWWYWALLAGLVLAVVFVEILIRVSDNKRAEENETNSGNSETTIVSGEPLV